MKAAEGPVTVTLTDDELDGALAYYNTVWLDGESVERIVAARVAGLTADLATALRMHNVQFDRANREHDRADAAEQALANIRAALLQGGQTHAIRWKAAVNALPAAPTEEGQ